MKIYMTADHSFQTVSDLDSLSTKDRLLLAGTQLFSKYGYEAATARMIADTARTNVASMAFHFGSKENYYYAVLSYAAEIVRSDYAPFWTKVEQAHMDKKTEPEQAWDLIEEYVDLVLSIVMNVSSDRIPNNTALLHLLFREQLTPAHGQRPITSVLCTKSEAMLKLFLMDYWQNPDEKNAVIVSRAVTGAIISFAEYPVFIRHALGWKDDQVLGAEVWSLLRTFILDSIKNYRPTPSSVSPHCSEES